MSKYTILVSGISADTDDKEVKDFFSFCGTIAEISVQNNGTEKKATVTFQKDAAMKTALLLNNTQLNANKITVTSASPETGHDGAASPVNSSDEGKTRSSDEIRTRSLDESEDHITQEEKPRTRIFAEYLAQGYAIGDAALTSAIDLDKKHGVSARFLSTLQNLDAKTHATERARTTDESYGITNRGKNFLFGLSSYFEKAASNPTGKKIADFYTQSSQQVHDIHAEAMRLKELKKEENGGSAYRAAGLNKIFGEGKPAEGTAPGPNPGAIPTPASTAAPAGSTAPPAASDPIAKDL